MGATPTKKGLKEEPMVVDEASAEETPQSLTIKALLFNDHSGMTSTLASGGSLTMNSAFKSSDNPAQRKVDEAIGTRTLTVKVTPEGGTLHDAMDVMRPTAAV